MQKRWLAVYIYACFFLSHFCFAIPLPPDLEKIISRGQLIVAIYGRPLPPYEFTENGKLVGLDISLAKNIAEMLGVKIIFTHDAKYFDDLINDIAENKADFAISALSRTLARAKYVRFTDAYLHISPTLIVNRLQLDRVYNVQSAIDIVNKEQLSLGVLKNTAFINFAKIIFPKAKLVEFDNLDELVDALMNSKLAVGISGELITMNLFHRHPELAITLNQIVLNKLHDNICIAVNYKNTQLVYWLNIYLKTIIRNGHLTKLKAQYLGKSYEHIGD